MVIDHIAKPHFLQVPGSPGSPESPGSPGSPGSPTLSQASEFDTWAAGMAAAPQYPNVYCKLSGLINEVQTSSVCQ